MPEGPEVRRQADRIRRAVGQKRTCEVYFGLERLQPFGPELSGRLVETVESRGKALLIHFEGRRTVYSHNQLYGRWYIVSKSEDEFRTPRTGRQLRFGVYAEAKAALLYSASEIEVLDSEVLEEHPFLRRLGPDVLEDSTCVEVVEARLCQPEFRGRSLGVLLLDQSFVAGLGNYLRSEILFSARLLPDEKARALTPPRRARLAAAILEVSRRAYRTGGITVDDDLAKRLKEQGLRKRQLRHYVFSREGRTCRRCDTPVERREVSGRRLYFCPGCQV